MERKPLPRSTPEKEGVKSEAIEKYIRALNEDELTMHGLAIIRHGKIVYESYWKPFDENFMHRLYSCSKSIVSMAIGYLIGKGVLSIDDRCMKYFPDKAHNVDPYLDKLTIRDLLMMASPYTKGANYTPKDPVWEDTYFSDEVSHAPGTIWYYCTSGTTMLCSIIKRVTGKEFFEVLRPVFDEIGVSEDIFCIESPEGLAWGGSGICATMRDFMKIGLLAMNRGKWNGKQLLPYDYMLEATTKQIDNSTNAVTSEKAQGYGYQFWMMKNNGFAMYGMGCQYALCFPDKDFMVITTAYEELYSASHETIFKKLWDVLLPSVSDAPYEEDTASCESLKRYSDTLELYSMRGEVKPTVIDKVNGKTYIMRENAMGMKEVSVEFEGDIGKLRYINATGSHELIFGINKNVFQEFPEIYSGKRLSVMADKGYKCCVSAKWLSPKSLIIYCQIIDMHLGQLKLQVSFKDNTINLFGYKHAEFYMDEFSGFAAGEM